MLPFTDARLMPLQLIVQVKGHQTQSDLPPLQTISCQYLIFTRGYFVPGEWWVHKYIFFSVQFNFNFKIQELRNSIFLEMTKMRIKKPKEKFENVRKFGETFWANA